MEERTEEEEEQPPGRCVAGEVRRRGGATSGRRAAGRSRRGSCCRFFPLFGLGWVECVRAFWSGSSLGSNGPFMYDAPWLKLQLQLEQPLQ